MTPLQLLAWVVVGLAVVALIVVVACCLAVFVAGALRTIRGKQ